MRAGSANGGRVLLFLLFNNIFCQEWGSGPFVSSFFNNIFCQEWPQNANIIHVFALKIVLPIIFLSLCLVV